MKDQDQLGFQPKIKINEVKELVDYNPKFFCLGCFRKDYCLTKGVNSNEVREKSNSKK